VKGIELVRDTKRKREHILKEVELVRDTEKEGGKGESTP
jgi:hypothetical protein